MAPDHMRPNASKPFGQLEGAPGDVISAASAPGSALYLMREFVLAPVNKAPRAPWAGWPSPAHLQPLPPDPLPLLCIWF